MSSAEEIPLRAEMFDASGLGPVELAVEPGMLVALVGAQGSGKSAWLEALAGLRAPLAGSVRLFGSDPAAIDAREWRNLRTRIGYASQDAPLLSNLNAQLNVMLPRLYHLHEKPEDAERAASRLLRDFDCEHVAQRLPAYLDRLERLKVLLARALALDPPLVFLDEPFSLDVATAWPELSERIAALVDEQQRAVVIATQNLRFVARAQRIVFLGRDAAFIFDGWNEFARAPQVAEYLASAPMRPEAA